MKREEITIRPPDCVLGAIRPLNKDHVDIALVRDTFVHTVYLATSDVGCGEKEEGRDSKGRRREGGREGGREEGRQPRVRVGGRKERKRHREGREKE